MEKRLFKEKVVPRINDIRALLTEIKTTSEKCLEGGPSFDSGYSRELQHEIDTLNDPEVRTVEEYLRKLHLELAAAESRLETVLEEYQTTP